jgi:hypothetical protein
MRNVLTLIGLLLGLLAAAPSQATELNATVEISLQNVTITDQNILASMKKDMQDFLNTRTWTKIPYRVEGTIDERIKVRMFVGITAVPQNGSFQTTMRLIATRPIYGTGYETNLLNINDRSFNFNYTPNTPLDFSPNSFVGNLASLLGFYAYMVIGTDQDTFSRFGGSTYYDQARIIAQYSAQQNLTNESDPGWTDSGPRNRYWLLENLTAPQLEGFRTALYGYYRQGMDVFIQKPDEARASIMTALGNIQKANVQRPQTLFVRAFFDAKADEITNIFRTAPDAAQKQQLITMMTDVDPGNLEKYQTITRQ